MATKKIPYYLTSMTFINDTVNPAITTELNYTPKPGEAKNIKTAERLGKEAADRYITRYPENKLIKISTTKISEERYNKIMEFRKAKATTPTNPNVNNIPDNRQLAKPEYPNDILNDNPLNYPPENEKFKAKILAAKANMTDSHPHIQLAVQLMDTAYDHPYKLKDGSPVWYTRLYTPIFTFDPAGNITGTTEITNGKPKIPFLKALAFQTYELSAYPDTSVQAWAHIKANKWLWVHFIHKDDKVFCQVTFPDHQHSLYLNLF